MGDNNFNFEELRVYKESLEFVGKIYNISKLFPESEKYLLTNQLVRAAHSIALNIAERSGDTNPQFRRFLQISQGSIRECIVCISIAERQKYLSSKQVLDLRKQLSYIGKMITKLQIYLSKDE